MSASKLTLVAMYTTRRQAMLQLLFGPSLIGLRAAVSGIPASVLLAAPSARADELREANAKAAALQNPQFVVFSTSQLGDPINCNAPGTYENPAIYHPPEPDLAATPINLGSSSVKGGKLWASLPAQMLAQTCFFHHSTYTAVHPDQTKVLHAQGATRGGEILPSVISKLTAPALGTLRVQPISFNDPVDGAISCDGVLQPSLSPRSLASLLAVPKDGLGDANLLTMRDKTVDALHAWLKGQGGAAQAKLVDAFAASRDQVRRLQTDVVSQLSSIRDNSSASQLKAAAILFKMKVAPVVMVRLPFGGDNHSDDVNNSNELRDHRSSVGVLAGLPALLEGSGLTGKVTFCSLNVFGRSLVREGNGRNHNDQHAVSLLVGGNVKGGVIGGLGQANSAQAFRAQPIDSTSGAVSNSGDVRYEDSLASYAKTLVAAAGVDVATTNDVLRSGTVVQGALAF